MWFVLVIAGVFTTLVGIVIGLPTLRLRGDYLAIVTLGFGEIVPQFVRNADTIGGFDLTDGTFGIAPIDSLGVRRASSSASSRTRTISTTGRRSRSPLHGLLLHPAARLAPRTRVDRDPRGRDRGGGDGRAADAHEDLVVRDRRVLRRSRRSLLRELPLGAFPADFYFNISIFLLCMVILGGMGSIWGVFAGGMILSYLEHRGACRRSARRSRTPG